MSVRMMIGLIVVGAASSTVSSAQMAPTATFDATALVRRATQHRLDAMSHHRPLRYLLHRIDSRSDTTRDVIETNDGDVSRLVAIDGRPLSAEANQAELNWLNDLATHPEIQDRLRMQHRKDTDRINRFVRLLPGALLYRFEGMVPCGGGWCYLLSFSPNPNFTPPNREAKIFRGLAGEVWIDQTQERLTRVEAHLVANVDFGWGIIGRLYKGGTIMIEQEDIGGNDWELTRMKFNITGKALMVKSLRFQFTEELSNFSPAQTGLNFRAAIKILEQSESLDTHNGR